MFKERFIPRLTRRRALGLMSAAAAGYLSGVNISQRQATEQRISLVQNDINRAVGTRMAQMQAQKPDELRKSALSEKQKQELREWDRRYLVDIAQTRESEAAVHQEEMSYLEDSRSVFQRNTLMFLLGTGFSAYLAITRQKQDKRTHFVSMREMGINPRIGLGRLFRKK